MKRASRLSLIAALLAVLPPAGWSLEAAGWSLEAAVPSAGILPIARIRESIVCCPLDSIVLDGWASIVAKGEIARWIWDLNGDGVDDTSCTSGSLGLRAPGEPRSSMVVLKVKDSFGNVSNPDTSTLHVMNSPPRASVGADTSVRVGVRVMFEPSVVSHCSKPVRFEWDFNDDGKPEFRSIENGNTSRAYFKPGKYYARFKVFDDLGRETGGLRIITVQ